MGDLVFWFFSSLGLGAVQLVLNLPAIAATRTRLLGITAVLAWALSGACVLTIKAFVDRPRPTNLVETIRTPGELIFHGSFPSGHTATSFAIAIVVALGWPLARRKLAGAIALTVAFLVGVSRVYRGVHYPTDVIAGASLGLICGILVYCALARWRANSES